MAGEIQAILKEKIKQRYWIANKEEASNETDYKTIGKKN